MNYLELVALANKYAYAYYTLDKPEATDAEYDEIMQQIKAIESSTGVIDKLSPTLRIGDSVLEGFEKIQHINKLYSLEDVFSEEEIVAWYEKVKKLDSSVEFYAEVKYDGLSLNLTYENGTLISAGTRGDGTEGENVTGNIPYIKGIPLNIPCKNKVEIRGEVVIFKEDFPKVNEKRIAKGKEAFKNERNAAAGSLRSFESEAVKDSNLRFVPYGLGYHEEDFLNQSESYEWIISQGFVNYGTNKVEILKTKEEILLKFRELIATRDAYPMLLDGMVLKVNNLHVQEELGFNTKFPKWALACKFPAIEKTTQVLDVILQVGKTGAITPVAVIKEVDILGTKVNRVTLHNFDEIARTDIRIGDTVSIIRSGDVIPKITGVFYQRRTGEERAIIEPANCPECGSSTERKKLFGSEDNSAILRCSNNSCPAILIGKIQSAVGKKALDIDGLGDAMIEVLVRRNLLNSVVDLFSLKEEDLMKIEGVQKKKASNIINGIKGVIGKTSLARFIRMLDIELIGERASTKIADALGERVFTELTYDLVLSVEDIGEAMAINFCKFVEENSKEIEELLEIVKPVYETKVVAGDKFAGMTFVITGTLSKARDYYKDYIESLGGKVSSAVSKKTTYLLAGEDAGSKLTKAEELGVKVISEDDLEKL